nr:retrotransposable element Tf2 [Tanacetum cinerariifolium]
ENFSDVFEVPYELPPKRSHDHKIPLIDGTPLVNIRPYRHPPIQKNAIEVMVKELLDSEVVRPIQMENFSDVFEVPYELPPKRSHDHKIPLIDGTPLVNIRPYRHPPIQKNAIEVMVKELLDSGVVRPIQSSFASPIVMSLQDGIITKKHYTWSNDQLLRKNKLVIGKDEELKKELMAHFHGSSVRGHSGVKVTTHRMSSILYWKGMRKDIKKFVHECIHCQRNKLDLASYPGLLQPLPIPNKIWESINMDFIEALPRSQGYTVIFVVVDRLTKYAHFMPLSHPFTAAQVAQEFLDTIYKLHGLPTSIVSDRDKFFLIYVLPPPTYVPYFGGFSKVDAVDRTLEAREQAIKMLKFYLSISQNKTKQQADKKRTDRVLQVGDYVFLKLYPHRQVSMRQVKQSKFSPKCFGPFKVLEKIRQTILLGLSEDIYAAVDSCETTQEIWLRDQQMMKGSDIGIQEKKEKLFNEWERFTSNEGESIESYYHRFLKLMNDLKRNKHFPEKIASNLKFLNNLQPEWSRHVTIVHQTKELHTADYTQLYDFLKYNQKEVIQNAIQNPRVQNVGNRNQNQIGNGNLVAVRAEGNAAGHNG